MQLSLQQVAAACCSSLFVAMTPPCIYHVTHLLFLHLIVLIAVYQDSITIMMLYTVL